MDAINQNKQIKETTVNDPKVIIVKQEQAAVDNQSNPSEATTNTNQLNPHSPYGASNNPYFAYPADYYDDEYDDDYDEYDDEEYEEDEWEEDK